MRRWCGLGTDFGTFAISLSIKISYFRICFCTFDLSCSILKKDNCIENVYIVLSYEIAFLFNLVLI